MPRASRTASQGEEATTRGDTLMVQSVEKAMRVLLAFGTGRETLSLSQICGLTEMDKSTAQRFTHTLLQLGYLAKDEETRRYAMAPKVLDLAYCYNRSNILVEQAHRYLLHLNRTTQETANLTLLDGTDVVFALRFVGEHVLSPDVVVGTRRPAYCMAPGQAMLSCLPQPEVKEVLARSDLRPHTAHTTWKIPALLAKLKQAEKDGFAVTVEEMTLGDITVGAAILGSDGRPVGAVSISTSRLRMTPEAVRERLAPLVVAAAQSLSKAPHSIARSGA